jgi:protein gp37
MADTKIEWATKVWNPVTGCTKVSQGCKNCYAERIFSRSLPAMHGQKFNEIRCHEDRLDAPSHLRKPQRIFVNSMSDLFHEDVPFRFIGLVFAAMACARRHTFLILTKRPARMLEFFSSCGNWQGFMTHNAAPPGAYGGDGIIVGRDTWPLPNVWVGVSVEDQKAADDRIPLLLRTPAAVRFVSVEPMLGSVDMHRYLPEIEDTPAADAWEGIHFCRNCCATFDADSHTCPRGLNWVICGGESGPGARPMHPDWARSLRDQCQEAGVPFFFKQHGEFREIEGIDEAFGAPWVKVGNVGMVRTGKKRAGRLLDGREWNDYPNLDHIRSSDTTVRL